MLHAATRIVVAAALSGLGVLALAGCAGPQLTASASLANLRPEATTLALVSVDGPAAETARRFSEILSREAKGRGFTMAEPGTGGSTALKAYLDAFPGDGGRLAVSWVLQTSEDGRNRAARVSGAVATNASASTGWTGLDDATMRLVAARGLDDLARVLTSNAAESPAAE